MKSKSIALPLKTNISLVTAQFSEATLQLVRATKAMSFFNIAIFGMTGTDVNDRNQNYAVCSWRQT